MGSRKIQAREGTAPRDGGGVCMDRGGWRAVRMALRLARPGQERWEEHAVYKFKPVFFIDS